MLTLYGSAGSGSAAVEAALELCGVVSKWSGARAHLKQVRPDFFALLRRVESHPAVAPVFARHWPSDAPAG